MSPPPPVIILVEPQLAENIGMTARAMANFGLADLRLVTPRNGWPKKGVREAASGATHVLDRASLHATAAEAIGDLHYVLATTARERGQMKRADAPDRAMEAAAERAARGEHVGILFGRERTGLSNEEISLADAIVTFPVAPEFPSLNLAQAVLLVAYEWRKSAGLARTPFFGEMRAAPASRASLLGLFASLEATLDQARFYPPEKREIMTRNMRDMIQRMEPTEQDVRTFRGALRALGRRMQEPGER